mgnify:CR=1 FL=1
MADLQRIFDNCREAYKKSYFTISEMGNWLGKHLDSGKKERFRSNILCKNFDIVLQFSLLQIALADYDLDSKEVVFIRDLTLDGDMFEYLNSFVESKVDWQMAYNANISELKEFLKIVEPLMKSLSDDLVTAFAICDASTVHNYVSDLRAEILTIINGLGKMDGDFSYLELHTDCLIVHLIFEIKRREEELKKHFPEDFQ